MQQLTLEQSHCNNFTKEPPKRICNHHAISEEQEQNSVNVLTESKAKLMPIRSKIYPNKFARYSILHFTPWLCLCYVCVHNMHMYLRQGVMFYQASVCLSVCLLFSHFTLKKLPNEIRMFMKISPETYL